MRKILIVLGAVAALVALLASLGPPNPRPGALPSAAPKPSAAAAETPPDLRPALDLTHAPVKPATIRDVTSTGITPGPPVRGPLVRVGPAPKPQPPVQVAAPKPRTQRLFTAIVVAAGRIRAREQDIHLAGIAAPDFQARCGQGAAEWPCGRMARAALRRFIRGRAIECAVPPGAEAIPDPAECSVAGANLSEWLVAQGWARKNGERYAALEGQAREAKLGIWGGKGGAQAADVAAATESAPASPPDSARPISNRVSSTP